MIFFNMSKLVLYSDDFSPIKHFKIFEHDKKLFHSVFHVSATTTVTNLFEGIQVRW